MRLVERGFELLRWVDRMIELVPNPSVRGSERFPAARDRQVLKWIGVVTLGVGVGIVGGMEVATAIMVLEGQQVDFLLRSPMHMYDPTKVGVSVTAGMGIGLFGGIALANRIIDGRR